MKQGFLINPIDNVGIMLEEINPGEKVSVGKIVVAKEKIPMLHKIALCDIKKGEAIIKYGASIGSATKDIVAGEHVHLHNISNE